MRISSILIPISILLLFSTTVFPQSKRIQGAFDIYQAGEYFQAIDKFKDVYQKITDKKEKTRITFYIAECYRKINEPKEASLWYKKVIDKGYEDPLASLYYADMLKKLGQYEEAKQQYKNYKELLPGDQRATDGILSCDLAQEWIKFPTGYIVEEMKFFNSKQSDYSPAIASADDREVFFTSTRESSYGKKEHETTGESFADIYQSTMDRKGKWSTPVPLPQEINSEYEEGTPNLSADFNTLYFSRCSMGKNKTMGCQIFISRRKEDSWEKAHQINIEPDSIVTAHPAISPDGLTLYFVSDMAGSMKNEKGKNSKDIWKVTRATSDAEWDKPVNLGEPINTAGDEEFPYVHKDGTLYFSSNGLIGMGGLDIFKAKPTTGGGWDVQNMKYPINSSSDDFGICFEVDKEAGFLSSSRKGKGDDIYEFILPPLKFTITGVVKNEKTNEPIVSATIKSISSDGISLESSSGKGGTFKFDLKAGTDYVFIASKEGYLQGKERETTKGKETSSDFTATIYLSPINEPIRIDNIFFDFASADLRPESMVSLDKLVETLNDNPNIVIELGSNTDARGNDEFNLELSKHRAQSVVNYLISKGIDAERMVAKGYGKTQPKTVDRRDHEAYPFLPDGQLLTEQYINALANDDLKELAHSLNRRTEFRVLRTDYVKKK